MPSLQKRAWALLLPALWLSAEVSAAEFSGTYQLQNVVDNGVQVTATLVVQLSNNTGGDVSDATLTLIETPQLPMVTDLTYPGLSVASGAASTLQADITVPSSLYQQWQSGIPPYLLIQYVDGSGASLQRPVDLSAGGL